MIRISISLLLYTLLCWGCNKQPATPNCPEVTAISGTYTCSGECVVKDENGQRKVITVAVEQDIISAYPGTRQRLYQVDITGADNFRETEIGVLSGNTMRTATASVSDSIYPVLEEYLFTTDDNCAATGFIKTVRNPGEKNFKACVIICRKIQE